MPRQAASESRRPDSCGSWVWATVPKRAASESRWSDFGGSGANVTRQVLLDSGESDFGGSEATVTKHSLSVSDGPADGRHHGGFVDSNDEGGTPDGCSCKRRVGACPF